MSQEMHVCGSLPPELSTTDREVLRWYAEHSDGQPMTALAGLQDPNWVIEYLKKRRDLVDVFEVAVEGEYDGYGDMRGYRVKKGVELLPEHVAYGDVDATARQVEALRELQAERPELAGTPLLVPVPHPVDLALFTFVGPSFQKKVPDLGEVRSALKHLPVYTQAVVDYVTAVTERFGDEVVFHLEMPSALISMWKGRVAGGIGVRAAGRLHARYTAMLLALFPSSAQVILHLCYGDYDHIEVFQPDDLWDTAFYLNRLARQLRMRRVDRFPSVHVPATFGAAVPSLEPGFYAPLIGLDKGWDRLIAGVVHESGAAVSMAALRLFERATGRRARAVARACGMGRCTVAAAEASLRVQVVMTREAGRSDAVADQAGGITP